MSRNIILPNTFENKEYICRLSPNLACGDIKLVPVVSKAKYFSDKLWQLPDFFVQTLVSRDSSPCRNKKSF